MKKCQQRTQKNNIYLQDKLITLFGINIYGSPWMPNINNWAFMLERGDVLHNKWVNIPNNTGSAVQYSGSTTGPSYNEKGSPFQVSWSVRPKVAKVNIDTVGQWCKGNTFKEDHAHGVRNLVRNPKLLSTIK